MVLSTNNCLQCFHRVVQLVIDHNVVIRSIVRQFLASNQQPLCLGARGFLPTRLQALHEDFPGRWEHKHEYSIQTGAAMMGCTLDIDH